MDYQACQMSSGTISNHQDRDFSSNQEILLFYNLRQQTPRLVIIPDIFWLWHRHVGVCVCLPGHTHGYGRDDVGNTCGSFKTDNILSHKTHLPEIEAAWHPPPVHHLLIPQWLPKPPLQPLKSLHQPILMDYVAYTISFQTKLKRPDTLFLLPSSAIPAPRHTVLHQEADKFINPAQIFSWCILSLTSYMSQYSVL